MQLILGTSNFGAFYGLGDKKKINGFSNYSLNKIAEIANSKNIKLIDTSFNYKNSHEKVAKLKIKNKKIITKISVKKIVNKKNFKKIIRDKLIHIKKKYNFQIYALLIHDFHLLTQIESQKSMMMLNDLKKEKLISNTGVSIYETNELIKIYRKVNFDIVQLPINVLDNRFEGFKYFSEFKNKNKKIKIIARSCFLQGILSTNKKIPYNLKIFNNCIEAWKKWCDKKHLNYAEACMHYLKNKKYIDFIIVGFDNESQLKYLVKNFYKKTININYNSRISLKNNVILDPRKWKKK
jgi:aryl-alcohol dehydrogenase-like predicted oxidoreductase